MMMIMMSMPLNLRKYRIYLIVSIVYEYCNYMINEINANLELNFIYIILPNVIDKCYYLT